MFLGVSHFKNWNFVKRGCVCFVHFDIKVAYFSPKGLFKIHLWVNIFLGFLGFFVCLVLSLGLPSVCFGGFQFQEVEFRYKGLSFLLCWYSLDIKFIYFYLPAFQYSFVGLLELRKSIKILEN